MTNNTQINDNDALLAEQPKAVAQTADNRLAMTVEEAAARLGISRTSAYEAARKGELPTVRMGRRVIVPVAALEKLLAGGMSN